MAIVHWQDSEHFDVLRDKVNQIIDAVNGIVSVPVGGIQMYFGSPADTAKWDTSGIGVAGTQYENFALCLGQGLTGSQLENFSGASISTAPDFKGKFPAGYDPANTKFPQIGSEGGEEEHLLIPDETAIRNHRHDYTNPTKGGGGAIGGSGVWLAGTDKTSLPTWADDVLDRDGQQNALEAHNNLPPYLSTGFIIRYK